MIIRPCVRNVMTRRESNCQENEGSDLDWTLGKQFRMKIYILSSMLMVNVLLKKQTYVGHCSACIMYNQHCEKQKVPITR